MGLIMRYMLSSRTVDNKQMVVSEPLAMAHKLEEEVCIAQRLPVHGYIEAGFGGLLRYTPDEVAPLYRTRAEIMQENKRTGYISGLLAKIKRLEARVKELEGK